MWPYAILITWDWSLALRLIHFFMGFPVTLIITLVEWSANILYPMKWGAIVIPILPMGNWVTFFNSMLLRVRVCFLIFFSFVSTLYVHDNLRPFIFAYWWSSFLPSRPQFFLCASSGNCRTNRRFSAQVQLSVWHHSGPERKSSKECPVQICDKFMEKSIAV